MNSMPSKSDADRVADAPARKSRNLARTRRHIISATKTLLAREGVEAVSVAKVARLAGVNRSTAYDHFENRESLINATLDAVAQELQEAFFASLPVDRAEDGLNRHGKRVLNELALYFIQNARLAAIWLDELVRRRRGNDPLVRNWLDATRRFAASGFGRSDVDAEVLTVSLLSTYLIWPLWIDAESLSEEEQRTMAMRLSNELLRHALHGAMRAEKLPQLAQDLQHDMALLQQADPAANGV